MWHGMNEYGHTMGTPFGWVFMILFWGVLIIGIIYLIKIFVGKPTEEETSLDILKKRYARGEISREEYQAIKKELSE